MAEGTSPLKVALLGAGMVGFQVTRMLSQEAESLRQRIGRPLELIGIGVRQLDVERPGIDPGLFTTDVYSLVTRGDLGPVVEVIGGIEPARNPLTEVMNAGASVITVNKALLAKDLARLSATAKKNGVDLYYEAAVAGAIPIIRPLRESSVGDEIRAVMGIVNGTTNYILDQMITNYLGFNVALRQTQEFSFAEADPTADIEGEDAAAKAAILAGLAFHTEVHNPEVFCEGISSTTEAGIQTVDQMGCVVKLLAVAKLADDDRVIAEVHPAMVPKTHPLASVFGTYNAIPAESVEAGQLMFLGQGAGGTPTASAVMGDVVTVAHNWVRGTAGHLGAGYTKREVAPIGDAASRHYIRFQVEDRPGVLAKYATIFGAHRVSLQTCQQSHLEGLDRTDGFTAELSFMTHDAREQDLQDVVAALREAPFIGNSIDYMRIKGK